MKQRKTTVRVKNWSINGQFLALKLEVIGPDPRFPRAPHRASNSNLNKVTILMISYKTTRNGDLTPAGTSIVSDICDLSNISDIASLTLGSMEKSFFYHLFCVTQETYLSRDLGEIYI